MAQKAFATTESCSCITQAILEDYITPLKEYIDYYNKGRAVRSTLAANVINKVDNIQSVAFIATRTILNSVNTAQRSVQSVYREIGENLEQEWKMKQYKSENIDYYKKSLADLKSKGSKHKLIKFVLSYVFTKRLDFHLDSWSVTEKIQAGMVLVRLFIQSTNLIKLEDEYIRGKRKKVIVATDELQQAIENVNSKLEILHPQLLPMISRPINRLDVFGGGYTTNLFKKDRLIKSRSRDYLTMLHNHEMPLVYNALNHIQGTEWQVNGDVLDIINKLWETGEEIAELPNRNDEALIPFPFPELTKDSVLTEEQIEIKKKWKRETTAIHKRNVAKRSQRILVSQILRIANNFKDYDKIYFPFTLDGRGRMYPLPVLLHPQGSDLAKSLLRFAEGKKLKSSIKAI